MKIYSWNVNGIRSAESELIAFIDEVQPDILLLQELRAHPGQISFFLKMIPGYRHYFNDSGKPGYAGTGLYYQKGLELENISSQTSNDILSQEGRIIRFNCQDMTIVNIYTPNGNSNQERLKFKLKYYRALKDLAVSSYQKGKKVLIGGDFNVAHTPKDLFAAKTSYNSGYLPAEREWFSSLLESGFVDSFRLFNQKPGNYTWWHMRDPTREENKGWRFDYFLASQNLKDEIKDATILNNVFGSDHCPIMIEV